MTASTPPREYVMPRVTSSTNSAAMPARRVVSRRDGSVAMRSAIGIASTMIRPSAFQYSSGARSREATAVWLKSMPSSSTPGMIFPASA